MNDGYFDGLTRALAQGTSRRQALKGFFGGALGLGLLGAAALPASAAKFSGSSRGDIANTSAKLLAQMPSSAQLKQHNLPSAYMDAIEYDRQLLVAGSRAHTWSDSQLLTFQSQVSTSVQMHQNLIPAISPTTQQCFNNCATRFTTQVATCGTGLGGLLCELIDVVIFDLCSVGCILGGLGL